MNRKRTFLYQPTPLTSVICWSWTLTLLFLGLVFWLEVTYFQWITLFFFILAVFLICAEIFFRRILIDNDQITVQKVMNPNWIQFSLQNIQAQIISKHRIRLIFDHKQLDFILSINSVIELNDIINSYHK